MIRNSCFQNQWCCLFLGIQQLVLGAFTRGDRRTSLKYCWMRYHAVINQKAIALSSNSLKCHDNHYTVISDKVNLTRLSRAFQWLFPQVDSLLVVKSLSCCLHIQAFLSISQFIKHLYDVEIIFFFFSKQTEDGLFFLLWLNPVSHKQWTCDTILLYCF